jgi:phage-related protein
MFEIDYYTLIDGSKPAEEFINSLERKMKAKAFASIYLLSKEGNAAREPYSKAMGGGIFELRIKFASDITRIFYFFYVGKKIILTNGIVKKTNATPPGALMTARQYKADYERRKKNG